MRRLTCLITAGPTREYLDPVRYLSNASSGKMGYALAEAAARRGWRVILISGPTGLVYPEGVTVIPVISARQMYRATLRCFPQADIIIGAAAVADWRPARKATAKMRSKGTPPTIALVPNPDILKALGRRKNGKILVGFALETHHVLSSARKKLREKNLDMIVANTDEAIGSDSSCVTLIDARGMMNVVRGTKKVIAQRIMYGLCKKA